MKTLKIIGLVVAVLAAVATLLLFLGVPGGLLVDAVRGRIEAAGYRLAIAGTTQVSLWPAPSFVANNLALSDSSDPDRSFTAERARFALALSPLLSGRVQITEVAIVRPVARVALARERATRRTVSAPPARAGEGQAFTIDRLTVEDGTIVLTDRRDNVETRVKSIDVAAALGASTVVTASGRMDDQPMRLTLKSSVPAHRFGHEPAPVELTFEAPGALQGALTGSAQVRFAGERLSFERFAGEIAGNRFNGRVSIDLAAAKPLVSGDFEFTRVDLAVAAPSAPAPTSGARRDPRLQPAFDEPWSDQAFKLDALRFFDADLRFTAAEFSIQKFRFAPLHADVKLDRSVLTLALARSGLYGGEAQGTLVVDASARLPAYALRLDLTGMDAYPLLADSGDFHHLGGRMKASFDMRATGASPRAAIASLSGTADILLQNGEIVGINVAQMVRTLGGSILNGWQPSTTEKTDLTELGATFRIADGAATTENLRLIGPLVRMGGAGTADLAAKTLNFRVDPRLVLSLQGQGGPENPVGLGVPVMVQGPWGAPKIYPDMKGMLENPSAAFEQLRSLGTGLTGPNSPFRDFMRFGDTPGAPQASTAPQQNAPAATSPQPSQQTQPNPQPAQNPSDPNQPRGNFVEDLMRSKDPMRDLMRPDSPMRDIMRDLMPKR
jgi:AsmA protein